MELEILTACPLFKGLAPQEIDALLQQSLAKLRSFPQGAMVALRGETCTHLLIVAQGKVQGQMIDEAGKMIVIEDIPAPRPIAPAFLYAEQNEFPVNVMALEDTHILFIAQPAFTDMLQQNKTVLQNFLRVISSRSKFLSDKIMFLTFKTIKSKIAEWLLNHLPTADASMIHIQETQQTLADYFGVARPSLARALKEMEDEGLISVQRKQITLINKHGLKMLTR